VDETTVGGGGVNDRIIAVIRTAVPAGVGALSSWLLVRGIELDATTQQALTVALTTLLGTAYYIGVRWLSKRIPWTGWLLGYPAIPVYVPTTSTADSAVMVSAAKDAIALEVAVAESQQ
jgi:hypothetical protein